MEKRVNHPHICIDDKNLQNLDPFSSFEKYFLMLRLFT